MQPDIKVLHPKKLIGKCVHMNHVLDKTAELFRSFMPRKKEILNTINSNVFCLKVYGPSYDFSVFDPMATFDKWAAVEVSAIDNTPEGMESFNLPGGLYAVFIHKGSAKDMSTFEYIFGTWLPKEKEYALDNRPHFELLGEKYKNDGTDSEEEIWIPVKMK